MKSLHFSPAPSDHNALLLKVSNVKKTHTLQSGHGNAPLSDTSVQSQESVQLPAFLPEVSFLSASYKLLFFRFLSLHKAEPDDEKDFPTLLKSQVPPCLVLHLTVFERFSFLFDAQDHDILSDFQSE